MKTDCRSGKYEVVIIRTLNCGVIDIGKARIGIGQAIVDGCIRTVSKRYGSICLDVRPVELTIVGNGQSNNKFLISRNHQVVLLENIVKNRTFGIGLPCLKERCLCTRCAIAVDMSSIHCNFHILRQWLCRLQFTIDRELVGTRANRLGTNHYTLILC